MTGTSLGVCSKLLRIDGFIRCDEWVQCAASRLEASVVQDEIEERVMDRQAVLVIDGAQTVELVYEEVDS